MKDPLLVINAMLMLAFASIYVGTGVSLVFFSYPIAPRLTPETYHLPFIEPVKAATRFFTYMTTAMLATGTVMLIDEWGERWMAVPIVYLAGVVAATALTMTRILPINRELDGGVTDPVELQSKLRTWMRLNRVRVALWVVQWIAIATWFAGRVWA